MKLQKKEEQSVDILLLLRMGNKKTQWRSYRDKVQSWDGRKNHPETAPTGDPSSSSHWHPSSASTPSETHLTMLHTLPLKLSPFWTPYHNPPPEANPFLPTLYDFSYDVIGVCGAGISSLPARLWPCHLHPMSVKWRDNMTFLCLVSRDLASFIVLYIVL